MALDGSDHRMCCLLAGRRFEVFLRYVSLDHYFSAFVEFMQLYSVIMSTLLLNYTDYLL